MLRSAIEWNGVSKTTLKETPIDYQLEIICMQLVKETSKKQLNI